MQWSPDQDTALNRIAGWLKNPEQPWFSLGGYAGTGKTTLAKHIAENHGGVVKFAAFTGKAASVLRAKGCPGATTIHKLIYQPKGTPGESEIEELQNLIQVEAGKPKPNETSLVTWRRELAQKTAESSTMFERRDECEIQEADLVIIDESSMVDRRMGSDLESYGVPVLYLGDPGQLPPVKGKPRLGPNDYDFVLEEIHRQAANSPIIWLANEVRHGRPIKYGEHGDGAVKLLRKNEWDIDVISGADMVITGMNASRFRITEQIRDYIGFTQTYPLANDKLVCRKNDHDQGILNGVTCRAINPGIKRGNIIYLDIDYDGQNLMSRICDPGYFQENYGDRVNFPRSDSVSHFDYGYCITGHRAQGSEWRHVVIADDRMRINDRLQRQRWLYTVFTRAKERLTYYV